MKITAKLWLGIFVLVILSPIGLILPQWFKAGRAWGEWGVEDLERLAGYIPRGVAKISSLWKAPMADYALRGWEGKGLSRLSVSYIISAIVGITLVVIAVLIIGRILAKKGD